MLVKKFALLGALLASASATELACSSKDTTVWGPQITYNGQSYTLPLGEYNLFLARDYLNSTSDVQGRGAIGGDIDVIADFGAQLFHNFGSLPTSCPAIVSTLSAHNMYPGLRYALTVGGDMKSFPVRVAYGDLILVQSDQPASDYTSFYPKTDPCKPYQVAPNQLPVDFTSAFQYLNTLSSNLASLPATGTWASGPARVQDCVLTLHGGLDTEVVSIDGNLLAQCDGLFYSQSSFNGTLILNVNGTTTGVANINIESLAPNGNHIIWNFYEATWVHIGDVSFHGTILAPKAHIDGPSGQINGNVFADCLNGSIQINLAPFSGCIPTKPVPTSTPCTKTATTTPSATPSITSSNAPTYTSTPTPVTTTVRPSKCPIPPSSSTTTASCNGNCPSTSSNAPTYTPTSTPTVPTSTPCTKSTVPITSSNAPTYTPTSTPTVPTSTPCTKSTPSITSSNAPTYTSTPTPVTTTVRPSKCPIPPSTSSNAPTYTITSTPAVPTTTPCTKSLTSVPVSTPSNTPCTRCTAPPATSSNAPTFTPTSSPIICTQSYVTVTFTPTTSAPCSGPSCPATSPNAPTFTPTTTPNVPSTPCTESLTSIPATTPCTKCTPPATSSNAPTFTSTATPTKPATRSVCVVRSKGGVKTI
ncbi:uncharacterized protein BJ171DRAFT_599751 [Polychytrium aggregatum]|uniref:uncharacterized protein n=1 Tax=Polychytrium aggregatum TaxID=110093 RepID=UPI0022FF3D37|nr:uncharacterized protein BJ171DRAFT_599751 [Polychytrium aggregatum]KAI9203850.1 hypothetical protein BJ171DRAFT_599751 [Polychytrium aggregatum]